MSGSVTSLAPDASLLLPLAVLWPLALAAISLLPIAGRRKFLLLPLGPLPALAAAIVSPHASAFSLDALLLGSHLVLGETSAIFLGGAAILWTLSGIFAVGYMRSDTRATAFALFWNLVLAGNIGTFLAGDVVTFYVAFSLLSLMAYPLVIHDRKPASLRAGAVYIVLAVAGEVAMFAGLAMSSAAAGGATDIGAVRTVLAGAGADPAILWLLTAGLGIKAGLMPLHVWLPLAHPAAPTPASAVLSGAIVKAGIYGLLVFLPWGTQWIVSGHMLALLGFAGLYLGALLAVTQANPKIVLAYSTVSQMGLLTGVAGLALASGLPAAKILPALTFQAMHHGLTKGALFLGVGVIGHCGHQSWRRVSAMGLLVLLALSLAGLPLTPGALAKAGLKTPAGALGTSLVALSGLTTALAMARFIFVLPGGRAGHSAAPGILLPFLLLCALALILPFALHEQVLGKPAAATSALARQFQQAWPVGLAILLAAAALAMRLEAPRLPPGDILAPAEGFARRLSAAASAAMSAAARPVRGENDMPVQTRLEKNIHRLENVLDDRTAIAVAAMLVAGALLFSLV